MKFTKLCLVMTDKCSAACDFCGFSCCPENKQVMDAEIMERVIREAGQMGMKSVGFSGGEPFLYSELLTRGVAIAREEKMIVNIATNGFWGAWEEGRIHEVLTALKPDTMGFSYDWFHRRYVPEEHFFRALAAATQLGIRCTVHVADLKGEYSAGRFIQSLGNNKLGKDYSIYPLYRVGRAKNMSQEMFLTEDTRENLGCLYESTLSVLYDGDVYPCCRHEAFGSAMKLGNSKEKSLKEVIGQSDVPMICDVLMKSERFGELLGAAEEQGVSLSGYAGCSCDYCRMLFGTEEYKKKMLPVVEKLHGEMLMRSLMKEAGRDVH